MSQQRKQLLIVWCSTTGGSEQMARAAESGAATVAEACCVLMHADETCEKDVLAANGFLFVMPEHLGSMSGTMKAFFDRTYYAALDQLNGRPYALMVCAGSDGEGTIRQTERIVTGWRLRKVAEPLLIITGAQTPAAIMAPKQIAESELAKCREVGATLAAGLASSVW